MVAIKAMFARHTWVRVIMEALFVFALSAVFIRFYGIENFNAECFGAGFSIFAIMTIFRDIMLGASWR